MALALIAGGASGIIVEVHNCPEKALSDGPQSLYPVQFEKLMRDVEALCPVVGKSLEKSPRIVPSSIKGETATELLSPDKVVVAFQGERGAFSELAVRRSFDEGIEVLPCHDFSTVFNKVSSGIARYGVVPVENTLGGTINDNLDLLAIHPEITVVGEQQIRVIHNLIGIPGAKLEDIKEVYSHPQALAQCKEFLEKELSGAKLIPYYDTAGSVELVKNKNDKSIAGIAGSPAAIHYGMEIIKQGIETNPSNYTRFYIISREENAGIFRSQAKPNKVAITFSVSDEPGALMNILGIMQKYGLNMQKLESRPIAGKPWEYTFFCELQLHDEEMFKKAEAEIRKEAASFRELGRYTTVL